MTTVARGGPPGQAAGVSAAKPPRSRPPRWRLACWLLVLLGGVGWGAQVGTTRAPQAELEVLAGLVREEGGQRLFYRSDSAAVGFHRGEGFTLTVYVGGDQAFHPAEHLVLADLRGAPRLDLIALDRGAIGPVSETRLTGPAVRDYLARTGLDVGPIARVYADLYGAAR